MPVCAAADAGSASAAATPATTMNGRRLMPPPPHAACRTRRRGAPRRAHRVPRSGRARRARARRSPGCSSRRRRPQTTPRRARSRARPGRRSCRPRTWPGRRARRRAAGLERDDRGGLVGVRRADPADDLAVVVGLQRLEGELVARLALGICSDSAKSWNCAGRDQPCLPSPVQVIRRDLLGRLAGPRRSIGLAALARTLTFQPGHGLVGGGDEAGRELDVDLHRAGVVALVGHAHVEPREAAGGRRCRAGA